MAPLNEADAKSEPTPGVSVLPIVFDKSSVDDREYRIITLRNGLEALLVHDALADKASAAIDVGVGNFNDDNDLPGVAHAVEHLLFMGTKKFPQENAYNQFLASHSGDSNAYTAPTSTNYYFDISALSYSEDGKEAESPFYGALDRFAQFFINPLFLASTVDRELRAVDSENKKNLQSDNWRIHQLEKSLSNPKHPYCHFSTGNFEVLKTEPEARGINVREKFMEFHDKYYSANQMKLVVLGRESLDTLQSWVAELFSAVPNKNLEVNKWTEEVPYNPEHLGRITYVKPVMDTRELTLRFPALDETELDDSQPSRYVSHLIGHEGPGSIMSYIKSKGWANSLGSGMYPVCPGTPGVFQVTMRMTEEGLKAYDEILAVFFQYVALLRESPPQEWIFNEMKDLSDVDFKFKQKTPPSRFTSRTSALMNRPIPREHLLSGPSCLHKFDPELIEKTIGFLRPDNMRITLTSQTYPGDWDQKEKWYGTEYREEKMAADLVAKLEKAYATTKAERIPALHLPHKNQFVPTKLEVEKKEVKEPAVAPRIIRNTELSRTWYKKDDTFWVPKGALTICIKNPVILALAENYIKTDLFTYLVSDALEEYSYDADLAGLYYYVRVDDGSLLVEVSGYNDKLSVLLEQVLVKMRDLEIKDDRFDIIKERATRGLRNAVLQQPYQLISKYTAWITKPVYYTYEELAEELPNISAESVRSFAKELLGQMHMDIYVHGNFYKEDALKLTDLIESTLQPRPLPRAQWPIRRDVVFPRSCNYIYNKPLEDKENVNHALEYVLYFPDRNRSTKARALLLDQLVHEPAWDQLRTKEQLGYVVFTGLRPGLATLGYRFLVQSEKVPKYLEERVDAFLTEFKKTLAAMSSETFEGYKRSLVAKRLEKPKNLNQEISRHWGQISNEFYDFEYAQKDVEQIKVLTKADMVAFFDEFIDPMSPARAKVAVHLVAQAKSDVTKNQIADLVKALGLDEAGVAKAANDLQARLTAAQQGEAKEADEAESVKQYLTSSLGVADEEKLQAATEAWKEVFRYYQTANGTNGDGTGSSTVNGTTPVEIKNIRDFRTSMALSSGPQPEADISEFLDVDAKLLEKHSTPLVTPELPGQLTFTTSSFKKRRISRPSRRRGDDILATGHLPKPSVESTSRPQSQRLARPQRHSQPPSRSSSRHRILPSTEQAADDDDNVIEGIEVDDDDDDDDDDEQNVSEYDDDADDSDADDNDDEDDEAVDALAFSFTAASNAPSSGPTTPTYSRAGSNPLPPQGRRGLEAPSSRETSELPDFDGDFDDDDNNNGSAASNSPPPSRRIAAYKANTRVIRVPAANANATGITILNQRKQQQQQKKKKTKNASRSVLPRSTLERSQSPLVPASHRTLLMSGTTNDTSLHRSSSPLKRPASTMEQEHMESAKADVREVDAAAASSPATSGTTTSSTSATSANTSSDAGSSPPQRETKEEDVDMINVSQDGASASPPPVDEQIQTIQSLVQKFNAAELQEGTAAYLVSRKWLAKAQTPTGADDASATLGPVDNADIIDSIIVDIEGKPAVRLNPGTGQDDFEFFSKEAWDLVVSWHGLAKGQLPIVRYAHNTAPNSMIPNVQFELHPPVFTVYRLSSPVSGISLAKEGATDAQLPPVFMCSSNYRVQDFLKRAKDMLHIPMARHVRMWRIIRKLAAGNDSAASTSPQDGWVKMLLPVAEFRKLEAHVEREHLDVVKDYTHDDKYNGRQSLAFVSLVVDQTIVLDENFERNLWVSTYNPKAPKDKGKSNSSTASSSTSLVVANSAASRSSAASSGRSSATSASSAPVTRSRLRHKTGRTAGCVGLGNLGNTCYMNSALQCVRSVEELTKYFLVGENEDETNYNNPLGHNGNVANAYAGLLADIFRENAPTSVAPRQFKNTIGRYAPAFSGYGQQDSQEFLGFLLDGLQEDLSRVKKKPYISKPDSTDEMINNPAAIREMADQVWDITKRRDDSVIADLFTGMYKSTLICPDCQKVSITFDPFTNLTLPLPIQNVWSKTVKFVPLNDHAVSIEVELDKTSSVKALKDFVGVRTGVPSGRLVATEEHRGDIFRIYDDFDCVSEEIGHSDAVILFEVEAAPTNNTGAKLPREKPRSMLNPYAGPDAKSSSPALWQNAMGERLLVPVVHRVAPSANGGRRFSRSGVTCPPHFIVVTREEARSEDVIRRKILEKVATFSSWPEFGKAEEEEDNGAVLVASASDVSSSGNEKTVTDKSVESEDDMVDVAMKDADAAAKPKPSPVLRAFNRHRPKWVTNPSMFLAGELQNLFDMGYYNDTSSSVIPIKWPSSTDDKTYPRLSSRVPVPVPAAPVSPSATGSENETGDSPEEAAPVDSDTPGASPGASPAPEVTRMNQESDDERPIALRNSNAVKTVPGPGGRRKVKNRYGGKNGKRAVAARAGAGQKTPTAAPPALPERRPVEDVVAAPVDTETKSPESTAASSTEQAPLIRLGEGIMVDWSPDGLDAVFGKDDVHDELRGAPTFGGILETLEDAELKEKRRNRISRKKRGLTLDECLDEFEREEILSENDMWYCPRCKEHRRASKKFDLWKTPDILVVHLKRFSSSGWRRDKLDMKVDFPVEGLDITRRVLDRQTGKAEIYDLIGVDDHWGGLGGGHYTAFARNFIDGQWYEYNDSSVSRVSNTSSVVSAAAYLLFYRRRSKEPLGGPRFQRIEAKFRSKYMAEEEEEEEEEEEGEDADEKGDGNADVDADDARQSVEMDDIFSSGSGSSAAAAATTATTAAVGTDWLEQSWGFPSTTGGGAVARHTSPGSDIVEVDEMEHADSATVGGGDGDIDRMSLSTDHAMDFNDEEAAAAAAAAAAPPPPAYSADMDEIQGAIWAAKAAKEAKEAEEAQVVHTVEGDDGDADSDKAVADIFVSSDGASDDDASNGSAAEQKTAR